MNKECLDNITNTVYAISQGRSRKVREGAEESRIVSMELSVKLEFTVWR
jgi:hypothetical protein